MIECDFIIIPSSYVHFLIVLYHLNYIKTAAMTDIYYRQVYLLQTVYTRKFYMSFF